ncbi:hypothetical protein CBOM_07326 [Ceraceosorus bombacis]|uniref:Uncharacterized protein n=1 Tax=Ceraceosorus bombacis TaxID=401625 RepID=A0A0P1A3A8_9BASI|nr:hypothetical protein CBOM_07326 [Ceraceosorus bombacis]
MPPTSVVMSSTQTGISSSFKIMNMGQLSSQATRAFISTGWYWDLRQLAVRQSESKPTG